MIRLSSVTISKTKRFFKTLQLWGLIENLVTLLLPKITIGVENVNGMLRRHQI